MTVQATPWAIQGQSHDGEVIRSFAAALFGVPVAAHTAAASVTTAGGGHGVVDAGDLAVTQNGTPNMSVNVAAGRAVVRSGGTSSLLAGVYIGLNDATVNVAIAAADATNPRRDLVVFQVRDSNYGEAAADARITVVTGTPAASPSDPALTSYPNCVVLARVAVAAGATSITTANITDLRTRAHTVGGRKVCTSTTRPTGASLHTGLAIFETDTLRALVYDGSSWSVVSDARAWQSWTPAITAPGGTAPTTGTGPTIAGEYTQLGKLVFARGSITFGTGPTAGSGNYRLSLPVAPRVSGLSTGLCLGELRCSALTGAVTAYFDAAVIDTSNSKLGFRYQSAWPAGTDTQWGAAAPAAPIASSRYEFAVLYEAL